MRKKRTTPGPANRAPKMPGSAACTERCASKDSPALRPPLEAVSLVGMGPDRRRLERPKADPASGSISGLPDDCLSHILMRLPLSCKKDVASRVCKRWRSLLMRPNQPPVWGCLALRVQLGTPPDQRPSLRWRRYPHIQVQDEDGSDAGAPHVPRRPPPPLPRGCEAFAAAMLQATSAPLLLLQQQLVPGVVPASLLRWALPRAGGFSALRLTLAVGLGWRDEQGLMWDWAAGELLLLLGAMGPTLTSLEMAVEDQLALAGYADRMFAEQRPDSTLACLLSALGRLPALRTLSLTGLANTDCCARLLGGSVGPSNTTANSGGSCGGGTSGLPGCVGVTSLRLDGCSLQGGGLRNLSHLSSLHSLALPNNPALDTRELGAGLLPLSGLTHLELDGCSIRTLDWLPAQGGFGSSAQGGCRSLRVLSMRYNDLAGAGWLPRDNAAALTGLTSLDVSRSQVSELPACVSLLTRLETLAVSDNRMEDLPRGLSRLTRLRELKADGNRLRRVPGCVRRLAGLQLLDLGRQRVEVDAKRGVWRHTLRVLDEQELADLEKLPLLEHVVLPFVKLMQAAAGGGRPFLHNSHPFLFHSNDPRRLQMGHQALPAAAAPWPTHSGLAGTNGGPGRAATGAGAVRATGAPAGRVNATARHMSGGDVSGRGDDVDLVAQTLLHMGALAGRLAARSAAGGRHCTFMLN